MTNKNSIHGSLELIADFDQQAIIKRGGGGIETFPVYKTNFLNSTHSRPGKRLYKFYFMLLGISDLELETERAVTEVLPLYPRSTITRKRVYDNASQVVEWLKDTEICDGIAEFHTTNDSQPRVVVRKIAEFSIETAQSAEQLDAPQRRYSALYRLGDAILPSKFDPIQ